MKILISMASVDPRRGGPSTAVRSLAATLVSQGHTVTVIAHDDGNGRDDPEDAPYELLRFPLTSRIWQFSYEYLKWVRNNINRYDAVLVHSLFLSHSYFVPGLARKFKIPYAIRPHGSLNIKDMARNRMQKSMYLAAIERRNLLGAAFLFCTSEREAKEAIRYGNFRTEVIPLGVDSSVIADRNEDGVNRDLVAFIGRLTRKKGIEIVIQSMPSILAKNPNARFVVAGPDDENLQDGFEALARRLNVQESVTFPGHLDASGRNELLAQAGVFVLPSLDENFGIGVAEAMTAGVPVVITPGVSHASYVEEYKAGLVSTRDPENFASKVLAVQSADQDSYLDMSANARRLVREKYSWTRSAQRLASSFSD
jgi:glycosyltransferase involved in cell wall biosynthesis